MTTLGALLLSSICFAQQLKTYNGEYDLHSYDVKVAYGINPGLLDGTATYSYYENEDLERIRSGKFNYTGKLSGNGSTLTVTISGNYKENKKHGKWVVNQSLNASEVRSPGRVPTPATSYNLRFEGDFKDGLPNGLWSSTLSSTQKGKTVSGTYTLNFSNNVINGDFKMIASDLTTSIKGSLDKNGYFTGKTIVQKDGDEYQITFNNGLLVSLLGRNLQSGNIFDNYKVNEEELAYFNKLLNEKDSSIIDEIPFKIVDGNNYVIDKLISNDFFDVMKNASLFNVTPGDFSIDENKRYNWVGFKVRALENSETKTEKLARLKAEEERLQMLEAEKLARLKAEEERLRMLEAEKLARLKAEEERLQILEAEKLARLKAEEERLQILEAEKLARLKAEEVNNLNSKARESMLKKNYVEAITFCEKGIELEDDNLYLKGNLAHGYLLIGEFEKARKIYLENIGYSINKETSWLKMIEMDFAEFDSKGIKSKDMNRILYEVRMNKEERQNYALLSGDERYKKFKKNKKKASINKYFKDTISN